MMEMMRKAKGIKAMYPEGTRVALENMNDSRAVAPGTKGTVQFVDDMGTIHVNWDTGSSLGLIVGEDSFSKVGKED